MPLLVLLIPATIVTVLVVVVLAIISTFQAEKEKKFNGLDAVLAGIHFLALLAVTLAVVQLGFVWIEKLIPDLLTDTAWRANDNKEYARVALAVLFVATPLFLVVLYKGAQAAKSVVSWTKRFLSVTVLLVAGLVLVGTLVTLIYGFLSGELGIRMLTKAGLLILVAGGVASYYQLFVRSGNKGVGMPSAHIFAVISLVAIVLALVGGFMVTGGPAAARAERFDDERLSDLSSMQWQINSYWIGEGSLPDDLSDLNDSLRGYSLPADPKTKEAYGYRALSEYSETNDDGIEVDVAVFELCATFETERDVADEGSVYEDQKIRAISAESSFLPDYYSRSDSPYWNHPVGNHCFEREMRYRKDDVMIETF